MEQVIQEFMDTLEDFFNSMDDEKLTDAFPAMVDNLNKLINSEKSGDIVREFIKDVDTAGVSQNEALAELKILLNGCYEQITAMKNKYHDSPIKQEYCDIYYSALESIINLAGLAVNNRSYANICVELCHNDAKIPTYAHNGDQGADIYAVETVTIEPHTYGNMISTGLKFAIPEGWAISIRPRSGLSKKTGLRISNSPATIDQQYRGEVKILFDNISDDPVVIEKGDRIAQVILEKNNAASFLRVKSVDANTERGDGGFGSTDVN